MKSDLKGLGASLLYVSSSQLQNGTISGCALCIVFYTHLLHSGAVLQSPFLLWRAKLWSSLTPGPVNSRVSRFLWAYFQLWAISKYSVAREISLHAGPCKAALWTSSPLTALTEHWGQLLVLSLISSVTSAELENGRILSGTLSSGNTAKEFGELTSMRTSGFPSPCLS